MNKLTHDVGFARVVIRFWRVNHVWGGGVATSMMRNSTGS